MKVEKVVMGMMAVVEERSGTRASRAEVKESREGAARECEGMVVSLEPP